MGKLEKQHDKLFQQDRLIFKLNRVTEMTKTTIISLTDSISK